MLNEDVSIKINLEQYSKSKVLTNGIGNLNKKGDGNYSYLL